jgi:hypothetical protein
MDDLIGLSSVVYVLIIFMGVLILAFIGAEVKGRKAGIKVMQQEAVMKGFGTWIALLNGTVEFRWNKRRG